MSRTRLWAWGGIVCLFCAAGLCAQEVTTVGLSSEPAATSSSTAAVPRLIKYSGAVRDARGEPVMSVAVRLTFAVYEEQAGGAAIWAEAQTVQLDEQGHCNVLLVSVPYALKAEDAAMLGGRRASDFVLSEQLKEEVKAQVEAQKAGIATQAVEMLVTNPPSLPAIAEGPSTFTCATSGDCVNVTQSGTGRALRTTATSSTEAILIQQNGTGYGLRALVPGNVALVGQITGSAGTSYGVKGQTTSTTGAGVFGYNLAATGLSYGVLGQTASTEGTAFFGRATSTTGATIGLRGHADSTSGTGIMGQATATSGVTTGILGRVFSSAGTALIVDNTQGGKLLSGKVGSLERFSVDGSGNVYATGVWTGSRGVLTVATGTPALTVTSTTLVSNLNSDMLDGVHASSLAPQTALDAEAAARGSADAALQSNLNAEALERANADLTLQADINTRVAKSGDTMTGTLNLPDLVATGSVSGASGSFTGNTATDLLSVNQSGSGNAISAVTSASGAFPAGTAVLGHATATSGLNRGVVGLTESTDGRGVVGYAQATSGETFGVSGGVDSPDGIAGIFRNTAGGLALMAWGDGGSFTVDANGNVYADGSVTSTSFSGDGSGLGNVNAVSAAEAANALALGGHSAASYPRLDTANSFFDSQNISSGDLSLTSGNISLPETTSASAGVINLGGGPFVHAYGSHNTFVGGNAGNFTTTGGDNTASGFGALQATTTGSENTASGASALQANTEGNSNTASGRGALFSNTTGGGNTASGRLALQYNTTGNSNTALGYSSGLGNSTGSNNTFIGILAGPDGGDFVNATAIGANALVSQSNSLILGGTGEWAVHVGIGTAMPAHALDVVGNINASGNVTASSFSGDGSALTGLARLTGGNSFFDSQSISGSLSLTGSINNALRFETTTGTPNLIGGWNENNVTSGVQGATIAGGGSAASPNRVTAHFGSVGGGVGNSGEGYYSTIGGGRQNTAQWNHATIGGGDRNTASGAATTVAGGGLNSATADYATVSGGQVNTASGWSSTVAGGTNNVAAGPSSFAAGNRAKALHSGAFVWGDYSVEADVASAGDNQFVVRAAGGAFFSHSVTAASFIGDLDCVGCVSPPELNFDPATQEELNTESAARATADTTLQTAVEARVLKAGDTMGGTLYLPANGLVAGTSQLVLSGGNVGIGTASPGAKLEVAGRILSQNTRSVATATDVISVTTDTWTDMSGMSLNISTGTAPVLILANLTGTWHETSDQVGRFRLVIDGTPKDAVVVKYDSADYECVPLMHLETLSAGDHTVKVQWRSSSGTLHASQDSSVRSLVAVEL